MRSRFIVLFLIVFFLFNVSAEEKPLTAVMPFTPRGVSDNDAAVITSLFEAALVNTEIFQIIEQNQVKDILDVQAYSLSGCTDESCAVELGKLLSAEQIVLGGFSRLGEKYIINVKLIDVEKGNTLRAETISENSLEAVSDKTELLAYTLAGLTYSKSGVIEIAREFGELFIVTDPPNADVFVNGTLKGKSPNLFQRIPLGQIVVEARLGDLYARENVNLEKGTSELDLELRKTFGNLFVKSTEKSVSAFLDGEAIGPLDDGFFRNLPAGRHELELIGVGLYWQGDIQISEDESTVVEASPRKHGSFQVNLPPGVTAFLSGTTDRYRLSEEYPSLERIWVGTYELVLRGEDYTEYASTVDIRQGEQLSLQPELKHTEEYLERYYSDAVADLKEELVSYSGSDLDPYRAEVRGWIVKMDEDGFEGISREASKLLIFADINEKKSILNGFREELEILQEEEARIPVLRKRRNTLTLILGILSGSSLATAGGSLFLMSDNYAKYETAVSSADAVDFRSKAELFQTISYGAGAAAGLFGIAALIPQIGKPGLENVQAEIGMLNGKMGSLELEIGNLSRQVSGE